jgi:hypothetical protein
MDGYRIATLIWRKAILIVAGASRKKPKGFLHRSVENTAGTENSAESASGE